MSFKIEGLEELEKSLNDIQNQLNPDAYYEWAMIITKTAKEICNDPNCRRIKLEKVERTHNSLGFEWKFTDLEAIDCVIKALKSHINSMPDLIREFFIQYTLAWLEEKKKSIG